MPAKKSTKDEEEVKEEVVKEEVVKEEPKRKSQKVKVLVSVYRYGDKIVSAHGIPDRNSWVKHVIDKTKLTAGELFHLSQALNNDPEYGKNPDYKGTISQILDASLENAVLPERHANKLKSIGQFTHEILSVEFELFTK